MNESANPSTAQEITDTLVAARSFLFVPANRPERFAKALGSGADAVILDLEDAIAPTEKATARNALARAFDRLTSAERARVLVRINANGSPWEVDDMGLLSQLKTQGLTAVMVPKSESGDALDRLHHALGATVALLPQIESVAGLDAVDALARASGVARLVFGNLDFQADLGLSCGPDEIELMPVRMALVLASRRANLAAPVDGVTLDMHNEAQLQAEASRSRRGGFGAKLCIHPAQVAVVNAAFTPTTAEIAWARRVMQGSDACGGGVFSLDGRMIDAPVIRLARQTLARSEHVAHGGSRR